MREAVSIQTVAAGVWHGDGPDAALGQVGVGVTVDGHVAIALLHADGSRLTGLLSGPLFDRLFSRAADLAEAENAAARRALQ